MLRALHVDAQLVVLDKPAGLLSVPGRRESDCLSARAQQAWSDALVVHRLDQATSGLFAMARGIAAQRALGEAFAARDVDKRYVARVHRASIDDAGTIELPLAADWPNRPRQRVDTARGKPSLTRWRVLARDSSTDTALLELAPLTGRSHQLRVHLAAVGHPIVGDRLYGPADDDAPRLMLHASALALPHPGDGRRVAFRSAAPFVDAAIAMLGP